MIATRCDDLSGHLPARQAEGKDEMTDDDPNEDDAMMLVPTASRNQRRKSPVNKITWAQVGLVTEPGRSTCSNSAG